MILDWFVSFFKKFNTLNILAMSDWCKNKPRRLSYYLLNHINYKEYKGKNILRPTSPHIAYIQGEGTDSEIAIMFHMVLILWDYKPNLICVDWFEKGQRHTHTVCVFKYGNRRGYFDCRGIHWLKHTVSMVDIAKKIGQDCCSGNLAAWREVDADGNIIEEWIKES